MPETILIATPYFPFPLNSGGNQAQYHFIDRLRTKFTIHLIYPAVPEKRQSALASRWPEVTFHPYKKTFWDRFRDLCLRKFPVLKSGFAEYDISDSVKPSLVSHIVTVAEKNNVDVFQFEFIRYLALAHIVLPNVRKVFIHHEIGFIRDIREAEALIRQPSDWESYCWAKKKTDEIGALNACDVVVTLTDVDAEILKRDGVVAPLHVSPALIPRAESRMENFLFGNSLVFVGGSAHFPNAHGLKWFLENIWEQVVNRLPGLRLKVIGKWTPALVARYSKQFTNVDFLGVVDDLGVAVNGSIMIVPILIGSGMRMKIIDGVNYGCPIITTNTGVEGIALRNGIDCLISDSPLDWLNGIEALSKDNCRCFNLVQSAHQRFATIFNDEFLIEKRASVYRNSEMIGG